MLSIDGRILLKNNIGQICQYITVKVYEVVGFEDDTCQEHVIPKHFFRKRDYIHTCNVQFLQHGKLFDCFTNLLKTKTFVKEK